MSSLLDKLKARVSQGVGFDNLASLQTDEQMGRFALTSLPYQSVLNPIFLKQLSHVSRKQDFYLVRDGLVPLINFFLVRSVPDCLNYTLILPVCSRYFVPEAWSERVLFYENVTFESQRRKYLNLLFPGSMSQVLDAARTVENFKTFIENKNYGLCHVSSFGLTSLKDQNHEMLILAHELMQQLKCPIEARESFLQPLKFGKFTDQDFFELSDPMSIYDSYLFHLVASQGAGYFLEQEFEGGEEVRLSAFHGHLMYTPQDFNQELGIMYGHVRSLFKGSSQVTEDFIRNWNKT
jgi:hypothetical protein